MARIYATAADWVTYTGLAAPTTVDADLAKASRFLDANVLKFCFYQVDANGLPSNTKVAAAFRDAACAQAQWWSQVGGSSGATGAGWGTVQIGSVTLSRSVTDVSPSASPERQIAPEVWDALGNPDLTPDIWTLGAVTIQ